MKNLLIAVLTTATTASAASATPFVYTTGGLLSSDLKTCLAQAKTAATQTGFTESQEEVLDDDKKDGSFYASKPDAPMSIAIRCFPTAGVFSLALSGINNEASFDQYKAFVDAFLK